MKLLNLCRTMNVKNGNKKIERAGVIVYCEDFDDSLLVLIYRNKILQFPKGRVDEKDATLIDAAYRELLEETKLDLGYSSSGSLENSIVLSVNDNDVTFFIHPQAVPKKDVDLTHKQEYEVDGVVLVPISQLGGNRITLQVVDNDDTETSRQRSNGKNLNNRRTYKYKTKELIVDKSIHEFIGKLTLHIQSMDNCKTCRVVQ